MRARYTEEERAFLLEHGRSLTTRELHEALTDCFGPYHTEGSVRTTCKRMGIFKEPGTRRRIAKSQAQPIGTEKRWGKYIWVRVNDLDGYYNAWKPKHCIIWEQHHGPVPKDNMVVFLNGDTSDITIENLACIPKRIAAKMVNGHGKAFWSEFPEVTRTALLACELDLAIKDIK